MTHREFHQPGFRPTMPAQGLYSDEAPFFGSEFGPKADVVGPGPIKRIGSGHPTLSVQTNSEPEKRKIA